MTTTTGVSLRLPPSNVVALARSLARSLAGCRYKQHRGKKEEIIAAVAQSVVLPFVRHAEGVGALLQDVEPGMPGVGPNGDFFVTVHSVAEGSQAEFRGLRAGDAIVRIGDYSTERMDKAQIGGLLGEAFSQMEEVCLFVWRMDGWVDRLH